MLSASVKTYKFLFYLAGHVYLKNADHQQIAAYSATDKNQYHLTKSHLITNRLIWRILAIKAFPV